ncbi:MAG: MFS transporter [Anaerolineales bacterium]|jgi:DHA1 family multidrug resistance protein-like MFS transporter
MKTTNRKNIYILAFTLVVVMLGFGLVIPIMPFYVENLGAGGTELGLLVASYAVMRLIFGPVWGSLSDRIGRKPVLMIGMLGYAITMFWFGLATRLWMLFVARSLSGILSSATSPTTMAYISDSTTEQERGRGMGLLGAAVGIGTIVGPGLGGWLAGDSPNQAALSLPFFVAGGMSLLSLLLIGLFLPESLSAEARQQADSRQREEKKTLLKLGELWRALSSSIGVLLIMAFLASFAMTAFFGIFGLFALQKFNYGPQEVGVALMVMGLVSALGQGLLVGPLTENWGEAPVIKAALLVSAITFASMALVQSTPAVLAATGFFSLGIALLTPSVTSLTSKHTTLLQGITMGLSNSFGSLGRIFGPLIAGLLLDIDINSPYLFGAAVLLVGFGYSLFKVRQKTGQLRFDGQVL